MAVKPITPQEVVATRVLTDNVIEVMNTLIAARYSDSGARVELRDVKSALVAYGETLPEYAPRLIVRTYQQEGWSVVYEYPQRYGQKDGESYFHFSVPPQGKAYPLGEWTKEPARFEDVG